MYTFKSRIRYSELGQDGYLSLSSVVNYLQDCSTFQSEDIGVGVSALQKQMKSWMLSSWQIQIQRYPTLGEFITVCTWAYDFNTIYGFRNFVIQDEQGSYLAKANSVWFLYDIMANTPIKVTEEDARCYEQEPKLEMEYAPRKVSIPKEYTTLQEFPVLRSQIDTNHHVNNGQYIQMALECIPEDFIVESVRVEYKKAAVLEDIIIPRVSHTNETYTIALCSKDNGTYAVVEFK